MEHDDGERNKLTHVHWTGKPSCFDGIARMMTMVHILSVAPSAHCHLAHISQFNDLR
jgi:hypothetical protein